jgi:homocysteine S-methyltransferase
MAKYRNALPQLSDGPFICDGGIETDLIFNHGIEIPEFAAHTLLSTKEGQAALSDYFVGYLRLAKDIGVGFVLDSQTWKAHRHWAKDLGATASDLREANLASISFISGLRDAFATNPKPIVLNGLIGPKGDGYSPDKMVAAKEAQEYHAEQISWLAGTDVDMITATTFTQSDEATGLVLAAQQLGMPVIVSFTVETDGALPTGQPLSEAITAVDDATNGAAAYFMINCAHPNHFTHVLNDSDWARRIKGIRCNASCKSHAELDESETLDAGDPVELGSQYDEIRTLMPWLKVFGGCCGSDLRHITEIAQRLAAA